jgi:S1-C subfamily serine protease
MSEDKTTTLSDLWAHAVETASTGAVRIEAGRCRQLTGTAIASDLVVTSQRALHGSERLAVHDDKAARHEAELVGADDGLDLALLRVKDASFQLLKVADLPTLRVGQPVFALGRPGARIRASLRIIGLLGEEFRTPAGGRLDRYIESDRGLPDGFEGGPLIDEHGALIGMNSSSLLRGADLSVPHATLLRSVSELAAHGRVRRGYLGVACQPVRLPAALRSPLSQRSGALVIDTEDNGPARAAGLTLGDVIITLDGEAIRGPRELSTALRDKYGAQIKLGILRNGQQQTIDITAIERG